MPRPRRQQSTGLKCYSLVRSILCVKSCPLRKDCCGLMMRGVDSCFVIIRRFEGLEDSQQKVLQRLRREMRALIPSDSRDNRTRAGP